ncbi:hypothetical protein MTO96_022800 [Rhipicephalus appendiculatus]
MPSSERTASLRREGHDLSVDLLTSSERSTGAKNERELVEYADVREPEASRSQDEFKPPDAHDAGHGRRAPATTAVVVSPIYANHRGHNRQSRKQQSWMMCKQANTETPGQILAAVGEDQILRC